MCLLSWHIVSNTSSHMLCLFVFSIPPIAEAIWGQGHSLKSHPTDWRSRGLNLQPLTRQAVIHNTTATSTHMLCKLVLGSTSARRWHLQPVSSHPQQRACHRGSHQACNHAPTNTVYAFFYPLFCLCFCPVMISCLLHIFKCTLEWFYF